jgi:hypothetical protein
MNAALAVMILLFVRIILPLAVVLSIGEAVERHARHYQPR